MTELRLKTLLASLAIPFPPFAKFMSGRERSELKGEPLYYTHDIINFIATFRTCDYTLNQSK